jgi:cytochrome c-type biogenesis protein CcmH
VTRVGAGRAITALFVALGLALGPAPALAVEPDEVLKDPRLERRARDISSDLRCLVCQNQSIEESDAPLAKDLRLLVRERLKAGDSDAQVRGFIVSRYGEFVLLRPRFGVHTALLWLAPALVLALGAAGLAVALRRRPRAAATSLSAEEQAALEGVLRQDGARLPEG